MRTTGELKAGYSFGAQLNGKTVTEGVASRETMTRTVTAEIAVADLIKDAGNRLTIARGASTSDAAGRLYYSAHLKAWLPVPTIKAADRGIVVQRRYVRADCNDGPKCDSVTTAKVGDVLRVELTIIAPDDLHYLQLEDPLPAGVEGIDTTLATASQLDEGPALVARQTRAGV
jgi:alpha-2-macroglobulin